MNAELPPFKNGEHNSEIGSAIDRVITLLSLSFDITHGKLGLRLLRAKM